MSDPTITALDKFFAPNSRGETLAAFTMPAVNASVAVQVDLTDWMVVGQGIFIAGAGTFLVASIETRKACHLTNTGASGNASPGTVIPTESALTATGTPGAAGAGASVTGTGLFHAVDGALDASAYRGSADQVLATNGGGSDTAWKSTGGDVSGPIDALVVGKINGASVPAAGSLTIGRLLQVSGASALVYAALNLATAASVTGVLPVANGGTGVSSAPTATGTAPVQVNGDNAAHSVLGNLTLSVVNASASVAGVVSTAAQSFAGAKTFASGLVIAEGQAIGAGNPTAGVVAVTGGTNASPIVLSTSPNPHGRSIGDTVFVNGVVFGGGTLTGTFQVAATGFTTTTLPLFQTTALGAFVSGGTVSGCASLNFGGNASSQALHLINFYGQGFDSTVQFFQASDASTEVSSQPWLQMTADGANWYPRNGNPTNTAYTLQVHDVTDGHGALELLAGNIVGQTTASPFTFVSFSYYNWVGTAHLFTSTSSVGANLQFPASADPTFTPGADNTGLIGIDSGPGSPARWKQIRGVSLWGDSVTAGATSSNPATAGNIRLPSLGSIQSRNSANNANVVLISTDGGDNTIVTSQGDVELKGGNVQLWGTTQIWAAGSGTVAATVQTGYTSTGGVLWENHVTAPNWKIKDVTANGVAGASVIIGAQNNLGATSKGGDVTIAAGTGTTNYGQAVIAGALNVGLTQVTMTDADQVLTPAASVSNAFDTNAASLTGVRTVTISRPPTKGQLLLFRNDCTTASGGGIVVKFLTGAATATIPCGSSAWIGADGTNAGIIMNGT